MKIVSAATDHNHSRDINPARVRKLNAQATGQGPVVYWMSRDQRIHDNWALLFSQMLALNNKSPLIVLFCLVNDYPGAQRRHYDFMLKGLREVESGLKEHNIPFILLEGEPAQVIPSFIKAVKAGAIVTDFDPLRIKRKWKEEISGELECAFFEVDAHNIVPVWKASVKQEFAAYTIRPKIERMLPEFLEEFPPLHQFPRGNMDLAQLSYAGMNHKGGETEWERLLKKSDSENAAVRLDITPGESAALNLLDDFLQNRLHRYNEERNDPLKNGQSGLSPYLHFGQLSSQRAALNASRYVEELASLESFLDELIVRKELSDNYCFYNPDYDSFNGFPAWARKSLNEHRVDKREETYLLRAFEDAETHDPLWNAAQREMLITGKMHGYMRMYWAKKILEWTASPEDALKISIYLNDKYSLDGRDPNGYTGIAWSIGGLHDRPWQERSIFGQIRYMNYNGCRRKFDVDAYIGKYSR